MRTDCERWIFRSAGHNFQLAGHRSLDSANRLSNLANPRSRLRWPRGSQQLTPLYSRVSADEVLCIEFIPIETMKREGDRQTGRSDVRQPLIGIAEAVQMDSHLVLHREVQAAHFAVWFINELEDAAGFDLPAAAAGPWTKLLRNRGNCHFLLFVADNGIDWAVSVAPDPRIPVLHEELRRIKGADFEVVIAP